MSAKIAEGVVNCRALPEIRPFRPFAKLREKFKQLEQALETATKRGEQLRNAKAPVTSPNAGPLSESVQAAPVKAPAKPSSNQRVNTLRRMTAEAGQHRRSGNSGALAEVKRAKTKTREREAVAARHRRTQDSGALAEAKRAEVKRAKTKTHEREAIAARHRHTQDSGALAEAKRAEVKRAETRTRERAAIAERRRQAEDLGAAMEAKRAELKHTETRTRERAAVAAQHRHIEDSKAAERTKSDPAESRVQVAESARQVSRLQPAKPPPSTSARAQSAKTGKE